MLATDKDNGDAMIFAVFYARLPKNGEQNPRTKGFSTMDAITIAGAALRSGAFNHSIAGEYIPHDWYGDPKLSDLPLLNKGKPVVGAHAFDIRSELFRKRLLSKLRTHDDRSWNKHTDDIEKIYNRVLGGTMVGESKGGQDTATLGEEDQ